MTPEQYRRAQVYQPPEMFDDAPVVDQGAFERRLALLFAGLALVAIGVGIGLALP